MSTDLRRAEALISISEMVLKRHLPAPRLLHFFGPPTGASMSLTVDTADDADQWMSELHCERMTTEFGHVGFGYWHGWSVQVRAFALAVPA